jgi:hypothetical protein
VGPAGDSLYQSQREEKKLMVDSEASSTSSEKGEISIMEEGEVSDDDDDDDMNGLQDNSGKKDNDTNEDRMKVRHQLFSPKFIFIGLYTFSNTALFFGLIFTFLKTFPFMCDLLLWSFVRLIFSPHDILTRMTLSPLFL